MNDVNDDVTSSAAVDADDLDYGSVPPELAKRPAEPEPGPASMSSAQAREVCTAIRSDHDRVDSSRGLHAHVVGTHLRRLRGHRAHVALEYESFEKMLEGEFPEIPLRTLWAFMTIAEHVTEAEASRFGFTKCVLGLRICAALELKDLAALCARREKLVTETGEKVAFPASRLKLESALRVLHAHERAEPERLSKAMQARVNRVQKRLDAELRAHPELKGIRLKVVVVEGELCLQPTKFPLEHAVLVGRILMNAAREE